MYNFFALDINITQGMIWWNQYLHELSRFRWRNKWFSSKAVFDHVAQQGS